MLDSFAERIGDNTWQTIITREGLKTVRKLLGETATKNTAVSCHWIRSRNHSELLWIVGSKDRFDQEGRVPVHRTSVGILERYEENDWLYLQTVQALAAVAALFHDWGKANDLFQKKLKRRSKESDPFRHEWISLLLFGAFVSIDPESWTERILNDHFDEEEILARLSKKPKELKRISESFAEYPLNVQLVAWLILSHHKLPFPREPIKIYKGNELPDLSEFFSIIEASWGYDNEGDFNSCLQFSRGLLTGSDMWKQRLRRWMKRLALHQEHLEKLNEDGNLRPILHHARLALILADHDCSSKPADPFWKTDTPLYANTDPKTGKLKQYLDEHLCGVCDTAVRIVYRLPALQRNLPRSTRLRKLRKPSPSPFAWQDKAVRVLKESTRRQEQKRGFFAVNMASTGTGKTIANAKIMMALSEKPGSLRYTLVLGLRTLTLQTGDEYRNRLGMESDDLAVIIGSRAIKQLHDNDLDNIEDEENPLAPFGSESLESLSGEEVFFEGNTDDRLLETLFHGQKERALLYAPVLVTTIDHMMGSVDSKKGGRHILPSLRLLSSDLVIDEIDDFDGSDLIAIGRLIQLAGMLGRKVMISSATIPPDLAEGYFHAYRKGWEFYAKTHEAANALQLFWVDEFKSRTETIPVDEESETLYRKIHGGFVTKRVEKLQTLPPLRKGRICDLPSITEEREEETLRQTYFDTVAEELYRLHTHHHIIDPATKKRVSFGVVRMANIRPCVEMGRYLLERGLGKGDIRLMVYHSQQILLMRHEQEHYLDSILKRKEETSGRKKILEDPVVRRHIGQSNHEDILFVVVATPVEEVGRDHDFDWALIEPSSWRSMIQMAGRVRRHRKGATETPNVSIMRYNYKAYMDGDQPGKAYFIHPGFETETVLTTHDISRLLNPKNLSRRIDAVPRIVKPDPLHPQERLADMEHDLMERLLTAYENIGPETLEGDLSQMWFLTALPQGFHPFRKSSPTIKCYRVYDEEQGRYYFAELDNEGTPVDREAILNIHVEEMLPGSDRLWLERDYDRLADVYAERFGTDKRSVTLRFGEISWQVYSRDAPLHSSFIYNDQLGLYTKK
ncbi:type I-F CRISPR-associated helicase Cas3f [Hydrogenimonas sp. SS33]|uniref:type I-F CRISPR-associated helicase Cas3f n=1 Tax=Hydrogenimonas leucolamina TaxID=2954236 RepID=UPI00336BDFE8